MNKRKNKIFLGCLLLLVTLSVGYAAFSENVLVTGTSKSQGTFDMVPKCYLGSGAGLGGRSDLSKGGYNSCSCNVSGNSVTLSTNLEYPTSARYFVVDMTNSGSLPVLYNKANLQITNAIISKYNSNGNIIETYNKSTDSTNYTTYSKLYGQWGVQATLLVDAAGKQHFYDNASNYAKDSSGNIYLMINPGETLSIVFYTRWLDGSLNGSEYIYSSDGSYWKSTITYTYPFYQFTRGMIECSNSTCS